MKRVVVVGGGASGMMAAVKAAENGREVFLIEKNDRLGKKLFITGKGRCNVTTDKEIDEIIENIPGNSSFLYSALYTFDNKSLMKFLEDGGVKLKVERGGRVFPESDKSNDIIKCFERYLQKYNVTVMLNTKVTDILVENDEIKGVETDRHKKIECDSLILATGGMSYPLTGSTGDGYGFSKKLGHTLKKLKPSLIPLISNDEWVKELMGLSLKNVEIFAEYKNKIIYKDFGEMLFTHFGLSGPIILSASRQVEDYFPDTVEIYIDLKTALDENELDKRILKDFEEAKNKQFKNSLAGLLPSKMIPVFIKLSQIDPEKQVNSINKEERQRLVKLFKRFKVSVSATRPIEEAIITRGGINVKEIDPSTMESKIVKELYIIGELLDVDALTGGFNLQIAFSTGYCAGISC